MKLVVQLKLTPSPAHATALVATLKACNRAANEVTEVAFEQRVFHNYGLRRVTYDLVREQGLGAEAAQHVTRGGRHSPLPPDHKSDGWTRPEISPPVRNRAAISTARSRPRR